MRNLIEFLEDTCREKGFDQAIESGESKMSFNGIREAALRIASNIIKTSSFEKKMIAVYMPKNAQFLCAMMGILYSGNIYIPMDYRAPIKRTLLIFDITQPILIITDAKGRQTLSEAGIDKGVDIYESISSTSVEDPEWIVSNTLSLIQDTDPAYLLFTSGSTGIPKGVVIPHRRVINYIHWAKNNFSISDSEIIGNQAPFYFTVSAMDVFLCLATGSKLCIIPENLFSHPTKLMQFVNERKITLIFWVSSVYHQVAKANAIEEVRPSSLRRAWFVGEPLGTHSLAYWMEQLPEVEFVNLYGSTETDMTICYIVPKGHSLEGGIPLGYPCANTEILLLKDGNAAAPGEIGEICVRGSCLALGYYKDIEKTQSSFTQNPLHNDYIDCIYHTGDLGEIRDGLLVFHGRKDHQFKHLGYRIEAGEIEAVAAGVAKTKSVCVLYDSAKKQIVLFYEPDKEGEIDELAFRRSLLSELPVYMVPTRFVQLIEMPYNANRKKDRLLLKKMYLKDGEKYEN